jgi:hypothetical protein
MLPGSSQELTMAGYQHIYQSNVEQLRSVKDQINKKLES